MDFAVRVDHKGKINENKNKDKYMSLARELKKAMEHEGDGDTKCNQCTWNSLHMVGKEAERVGNQKTI